LTVTFRRLERGEIDHELIWAGIAVFVFGVARWFPFDLFPPPACPFKHLTGYPCCTCGLTRGLLAFTRGEFAAAFRWNPLIALGAAASAVYVLYGAVVVAFKLPRIRCALTARWERVAVRLVAVSALVVDWAYLIAVGR
jgi:hypothetical protein